MLKLMKLELRRNPIRTYVLASAVIFVILLAFLYFAATVAQTEAGPRDVQFRNYGNLFQLAGTISLFAFSIMASVMYGQLVIGEYTGKRAALLFSYPVSRSKILLAKLLLVFLFTGISMLVCTALPYLVFSLTESVSPIVVQDTMTTDLVVSALRILGVSVLAVGGIGVVSMRIGFIKKSVPVTMIAAFALSATYGNAIVGTNSLVPGLIIGGVGLIVTVVVMVELTKKINTMEVE